MLHRRLAFAGLMAFLLLVGCARAQSVFCVEVDGKTCVIHKVHNNYVFVLKDGKLTSVLPKRTGLQPAKEFLPVFISVRDMRVQFSSEEDINSTAVVNGNFHLTATFESPYALDDVFLVLELTAEKQGKKMFYREIGSLVPHKPRPVNWLIPINTEVGKGHYFLHLFSDGAEVFHSNQDPFFREAQLDKMVQSRIEGIQQASPQPFVGPAPEYPAKFWESRVQGEAVVKIRISPTGAVIDPVVLRASDPAFGDSALAAVRLWRFLPMIKDGKAVATSAEMPFQFEPPAKTEK